MTLQKLIKELNKLYGDYKVPKWDNIGWQIQKPNKREEIKNILLCLDLNKDVMDKAIAQNCNLIITHHPFIFGKPKLNYKDHYKKNIIKKLKDNKIYVFAIHTNFDAAKYGMNTVAAKNILHNIKHEVINSNTIYKEIIFKNKTNLKDIIDNIKNTKNIKQIMTNYNNKGNKFFEKAYICMGSGAFLVGNVPQGSLIITGDFKWNEINKAIFQNQIILSIGHHYENIFTNILEKEINKIDNNICINILTINDPIHII